MADHLEISVKGKCRNIKLLVYPQQYAHREQDQGAHQHLLRGSQGLSGVRQAAEKQQDEVERRYGVEHRQAIPTISVKMVENTLTKTLFLTKRQEQIKPIFEDKFWGSQTNTDNQ